jgi:hypothetical protein
MNSNTYNKLSDDVINQIKDFRYSYLTEEQKSLIDELIPNEELRKQYKKHGLCEECSQIKIGVNLVTPSIFNVILTNGPVAIKKLMNSYKNFN